MAAEAVYRAATEQARAAAARLHDALASLDEQYAWVLEAIDAGERSEDIVVAAVERGSIERRREVSDLLREFDHAAREMRSIAMWLLLERTDMTVAGMSRRSGVSQELVRRLYRRGAELVGDA